MTNFILRCGTLSIVFEQLADRIAHRVELQHDENFETILQSVEGTAADSWPASPPLQSLHVEERPSGNVALLVGMSGVSHWSASISADEAAHRITVEVACRAKEEPVFLVSRYRWSANRCRVPPRREPESDAISCSDPLPRNQLAISPLHGTDISEQDDFIEITPLASVGPLPRTICWGYTLEWLP